jgi:SAM-dependent methyltransferase
MQVEQGFDTAMARHLGPEAARNLNRRLREGFIEKYLSGDAILDIGFRGDDPQSEPITKKAIGIDLDFPGYDGKTLPFPDESQDAVFASHILEHVEDWAGALAEWYRVLKIGGYMVVAVPHRDLYERKAGPPSRFNSDHKRFYTPACIVREVEEALPLGGYRIRSLKDVDDGFDYTIPPEQHAAGCYEIELVLEKIRIPSYVQLLRPSPGARELIELFAGLILQADRAQKQARLPELRQIQDALSNLPLPPFTMLKKKLEFLTENRAPPSIASIRQILAPALAEEPFDEEWYLATYPDIAEATRANRSLSPRTHFIEHGYFEGRFPRASGLSFG